MNAVLSNSSDLSKLDPAVVSELWHLIDAMEYAQGKQVVTSHYN